jgi:hypothetical protein
VVSDACGASADFLAGTESPPKASLERLLPCASLNSSSKSLEQGKEVVSGVVSKYDSMVRSQNGRIGASHVAPVCDPFGGPSAPSAYCAPLANASATVSKDGALAGQIIGGVPVGELLLLGAQLQEDLPILQRLVSGKNTGPKL